ncbi:MAG: hypothetical protein K0R62_1980 [Nonomuraea muscovyensis]|nr:hypothetical protein [Nonomuraea muscovyensis]
MPLRRRRLFQSAGATVALSAAGQVVGTSHTQAALPRARHHRLLATCQAEHFRAPNAIVPAEDNGSTSNLWRFL